MVRLRGKSVVSPTPHSPLTTLEWSESTTQVVLGLGSNLGDSRQIVEDAIKALEEVLHELRRASLYETEPMYVTDQNRFINTAVSGFYPGEGDLQSARELLAAVQNIEKNFGRDRSSERRWGERYLDIDILLFGNLVVKEEDLEIPHPRLKERQFALEPLLELFPEAQDPETGYFYKNYLSELS